MSSILKALKKIEGRKVDKSLPVWSYETGSLESMDRHIRRSRRHQKIIGLLIILCVIIIAGKLYIGSRPDANKTLSQNTPATETTLSEKPVQAARSEAQNTVGVPIRGASAPAQEPLSRETSPETTPPSAISTPAAEEETPPETNATAVISPPSEESEETPSIDRVKATAVETLPLTTFIETFATPPEYDAGLSLMALVWSPEPGSRFVVINGAIVHEGGSIEDSTVIRIEEDYAVVRTGGITWKLK